MPARENGGHRWQTHVNPSTPDGPAERVVHCGDCGLEMPGSDDEIPVCTDMADTDIGANSMSGEASPGMPWSDIAASAYRAYAASTGNKNFRGDPMPAFGDLPAPIRVAWEAAARHVGNCLESGRDFPPDEQRWAGWLPPQHSIGR